MVTAMEYRELALKFLIDGPLSLKPEEARDTYLRLARGWTLAALGVNATYRRRPILSIRLSQLLATNRPGPVLGLTSERSAGCPVVDSGRTVPRSSPPSPCPLTRRRPFTFIRRDDE